MSPFMWLLDLPLGPAASAQTKISQEESQEGAGEYVWLIYISQHTNTHHRCLSSELMQA